MHAITITSTQQGDQRLDDAIFAKYIQATCEYLGKEGITCLHFASRPVRPGTGVFVSYCPFIMSS